MCNDATKLAASFALLAEEIAGCDGVTEHQRIKDWFRDVPPELVAFAYDLVAIYKARDAINIVTGDIVVSQDKIDIRAGGDIVGSAVGKKTKVDANTIQNFKNNIGSSSTIDAHGQEVFKTAIDEINDSELDIDTKGSIVEDLDKIRKEIEKEKPNSGMLSKLWGGIKAVAGTLPAVAKLGVWLAGKYHGVH